MRKAFKYQIEVSPEIEEKLTSTLDICRELYNAAVQERRDAYKIAGKSINYTAQQNQLPEIKQVREDLTGVYSQVLQAVLRRVETSFDNFFRRIQEGAKEPGYPRFKGKYRYNSFVYTQTGWSLDGDKLHLSKIGTVRVILSQPIVGNVKTVTIKREVDKWFVSFSCEIEATPLPQTAQVIGIDVGLEHFLTDDKGKTVDNPRHLRKSEQKLAKAQRKMSRKKRFSGQWKRSKKKLAKIHTKIKNQRKDFTHKLSRKIVNKYDLIFFENLNIAGMVQNHHLAKSISDAGWAIFFAMLIYKAVEAGKLAKNVNPNGTSQECSGCHKKVIKGLSVRWHKCPYCGLVLHRDQNAALNILARGIELLLAAGLAVTAPGGLALAELMKGEPSESSSQRLPQAESS